MAPAAVSWGARLGWLNLAPTVLAFLGAAITPWILTVLALGELVADSCHRRQADGAPAVGTRVLVRPLRGRDRRRGGSLVTGLIAGIIGAVIARSVDGRREGSWPRHLAKIDRRR